MELEVEVISFPVAQILICSHDLCEVTKRVREPLFLVVQVASSSA